MADTPNNEIEKQLRDYAQQRRDAAGTPEMHPATRQMLQAEVKQRCGSASAAQAPAERARWARFWPRLAFALGVIAILGVAVVLIVPPGDKAKDHITLAKLDEAKPTRSTSDKLEAPPALAPAAMPATSVPSAPLRREVAAKSAEPLAPMTDTYATEESMRRDVATARKEPAKALKGGTPQNTPKESQAGNLATTAPATDAAKWGDRTTLFDSNASSGALAARSGGAAVRPAGAASSMAKAAAPTVNKDGKSASATFAALKPGAEAKEFDAVQSKVAGEVQNGFVQRYRNVAVLEKQKQSSQLPVLDEFTVAQNGETLTIVDRDGSVYNGFGRLAPADRQAGNDEASGAMQLVPNSYGGGRGGALLNQNAANRSVDESRAQSQTLRVGSAVQAQSASVLNTVEPFNYFFRVEGTNRSLNQRVVFTGNIFQNSAGYNFVNNAQNIGNNQASQSQQNATQSQAGRLYLNNSQQAPAQNSFNNVINGRVQLGEKKASELNALSVDP